MHDPAEKTGLDQLYIMGTWSATGFLSPVTPGFISCGCEFYHQRFRVLSAALYNKESETVLEAAGPHESMTENRPLELDSPEAPVYGIIPNVESCLNIRN